MNGNWSTCKLRDIADVRVSNVDKKTSNAEIPVKLCNYMDVYANDYVTKSIDFMAASASKSEIERFRLQAGDVIITKDSETPDDIGVPAVVTDSIDGLVCGYHLALIRPRSSAIDPIYLAKQLSTAPIARYFALNASGSTRFGLPISVIEDTRIPVAPKPEQTKIAKVLFTLDLAIGQTKALIAKQQRIKTGLMQDLLTRGIDKHGNLRSEKTHQFKDSPIGRIPAEWDVMSRLQAELNKQSHLKTSLMQDLLTDKRRVTSFSLSQLISQAKDLSIWLHEKTNDRGISNDRRSQTGSSLLQLSLDVADAIIILLEKNLPGPAWALARPLFESYVLGIWILKCASDEEVDQFLNNGRRPKFSKLLKAIDNKAKPQADWIRKTEGANMHHFHDFTHGGIQHVSRRITKNAVEPNYPEQELEYLVGLGVEVRIRVGVEMFSLINDQVATTQLYKKAQAFPRQPLV